MKAAYQDEAEIADGNIGRRSVPKRDSVKGNLKKRVTLKPPPKRGPKTSSRKIQLGLRLSPPVHDALIGLEAEMRASSPDVERSDVIRELLDTYAVNKGVAAPAPDIDPADALAGRNEVIAIPVQQSVKEFLLGNCKARDWTLGHTLEQLASRSLERDALQVKNAELQERIKRLEAEASATKKK